MRDLKYDLVCFDLDGTLIQGTVFIWKTLHEHFETDLERRTRARKDFFAGRISYERWFEHDLELLTERDATKDQIVAMLRNRVHRTPGSQRTIALLREAGLKVGVISGSLDLVLWTFFPKASFDCVFINELDFHDNGRIAGGRPTPYDLERKADGVSEMCRRFSVVPDRCVFVGDNYNDLSAARKAGLSVAFSPNSDELRKAADRVIESPDLTALIPILGLQ